MKYVIHFHTGQPQVTKKDSGDGVLKDITAAGATAAKKIANYVLDGCKLTHAGANLQQFNNLKNKVGFMYVSNSSPVFNGRCVNAKVATTQSRRLSKIHANQINNISRQTDFETNKGAKIFK